MIQGIHQNISFFSPVEGAGGKSLVERMCEAVEEFFRFIVEKIRNAIEAAWRWIKEACCSETDQCESVQSKLAPYAQMPVESVAFLQRSIDLLRDVLQRKEEQIKQNLQNEVGVELNQNEIPLEHKPLQTFNEQLLNYEGPSFQKVLMAAIRACIFSNNAIVPNFLRGHIERVLDDPLPDGNRPSVQKWVDYEVKIKALRPLFSNLPPDQQEMIIDAFDPPDIDKLDLPPEGKKILRDISAFSNALVQNNNAFTKAIQEVH